MRAHLSQVDLKDQRIRSTIAKILRAAANAENFFDLSDSERLNWMLGYAVQLGDAMKNRTASRRSSLRRGQRSGSLHRRRFKNHSRKPKGA